MKNGLKKIRKLPNVNIKVLMNKTAVYSTVRLAD